MKNHFYLLLIAVFAFSVSCEKLKEATSVDIETDLEVDIPLTNTAKSGVITKSGNADVTAFAYSGSATFSLSDNEDIKKYVNKIDDIIANGVSKIQVTGVPAGGKITACKLMIGLDPNADATVFNLTKEFTATNGVIEITENALINQFITLLKQNKSAKFKFVVTGEASYDVQTVFKIKVPVIIEAGVL